jgi:hypothetical protein
MCFLLSALLDAVQGFSHALFRPLGCSLTTKEHTDPNMGDTHFTGQLLLGDSV